MRALLRDSHTMQKHWYVARVPLLASRSPPGKSRCRSGLQCWKPPSTRRCVPTWSRASGSHQTGTARHRTATACLSPSLPQTQGDHFVVVFWKRACMMHLADIEYIDPAAASHLIIAASWLSRFRNRWHFQYQPLPPFRELLMTRTLWVIWTQRSDIFVIYHRCPLMFHWAAWRHLD